MKTYWRIKQDELKRKERLMNLYIIGFWLIAMAWCSLCENFM